MGWLFVIGCSLIGTATGQVLGNPNLGFVFGLGFSLVAVSTLHYLNKGTNTTPRHFE